MINSFKDVIDRFSGPGGFSRAVGMNREAAKQAKRRNSISAEWFAATERAAQELGFEDITVQRLAELAELRRQARVG